MYIYPLPLKLRLNGPNTSINIIENTFCNSTKLDFQPNDSRLLPGCQGQKQVICLYLGAAGSDSMGVPNSKGER